MKTKIISFEQACEQLGVETVVPDVSMIPELHQKAIIANYKLGIIAQAIRGEWKPDWSNFGQRKYYPWFEFSGSGFDYSGTGYGCDHTDAAVGSRLCFETSEDAEYFGQQFIDLHNEHLLI